MQQIEFKDVTKIFGKTVALDHISFTLPAHQINCIMGLSGSGKSTLLRHINRLLEPTSGEVWVNEQNIALLDKQALQYFRQTQVSMVFQHFALFPHLNVLENIAYGLQVMGEKKNIRLEKAHHWLDEVGLSDYGLRLPAELSGGQQQRVGIARAFACDTPILLMDEPFSALDPINRRSLQDLLLQLQNKWQKNVVFVTHDLDETEYLSDSVILMKAGRIEQQGDFQSLKEHPATPYVKAFMQNRIR
ncbi:hypothetical protein A6A19_04700 [Actinobacillus delphinicola]|uniref:DL-methionine transporter ATP-binding subunit n=2 Tax=Actinobacillus delphinicola TaxID=51161 RepID=A0A448TT10_9PAST|nr:ATP-binding cassette domain-containing protein [Actinobacillus delphinicola]MDG6897307.1 hypothetical protein [Actinobacillus delphinicola]VEJ09129.1 DL-methionine transporter ATP-binding subunit [Actinobacillus delphinicola]